MARIDCPISQEWCLVRVDPVQEDRVCEELRDRGIAVATPDEVLDGLLFVEYTEALLPEIEAITGVIDIILSNAGRVQDVPQSIVDALVTPTGSEDEGLLQLRSRLLARSEFYRLDVLMAEVARLQTASTREVAHV